MLTEQETELFNSDGKFRSYTNGIDKALKNFEYSSEWPDLISALGKLSKVIQSNTRFKTIPKSLVVSKRLAQCLHPSLPSGVHIKALEVYDLVFKCIHGNKDKIFTFSSGLYPLLSYAGMAVKPLILRIYEDHFLPLDNHLVDALDGLLPALLCGMEEGSDVYIRATTLLTSVKSRTTDLIFYTKLWDSMALSICRLPAINYMLQDGYIPEEPHKILQPLLECLSDINILTQRSALELINAWNMKDWDDAVRVEILAGAMGTLLRRDVSLNRRFYNMVIGEDDTMALALIEATRKVLSTHPDKFRIIMMLFDKPEICTKIMESILIDVIRTLHATQEKDSLSMLMCNLEPAYIITYLSNQDLNPEICRLISFIHNYIGGDFTTLLLKLIEPEVHKLELAIEILNGKPSCDMDLIRNKVTSLYTKMAPCNEQLFSDYTAKRFDFDDIITNIINDDECIESVKKEIEPESDGQSQGGVEDAEPLTCYYSLSESLAIDSVDSCNYHFGLNDFNSNRCYMMMGDDDEKIKVVAVDADEPPIATTITVKDCSGERSNQIQIPSDTSKVDSLSSGKENNNNNDSNSVLVCDDDDEKESSVGITQNNHALQQTGADCTLESVEQLSNHSVIITLAGRNNNNDDHPSSSSPLSLPPSTPVDEETPATESLLLLSNEKCDNRSNSTETFDSMNESTTSTLKLNSSENLGNESLSRAASNESPVSITSHSPMSTPNYNDLLSVLHQTLPPLMTQSYETIPYWLQTLLSHCIDASSTSAMESLLEILDNEIEIIPKIKLRKLQIVNNIVNHLWDTKSHQQLSRFLYHFPETESNIVIKLNHYNEILQFQDFIINNNTIVDSCILKLLDNLKSNDQLLSHCSYELLNRLVKQSVSIVLDPIIINLLDKSTRRHYIDVKSNSTPDLTKLHATNKVLNRSTGNLTLIDSPEVNVLVYNSMYDTRRIKFILEKLQSLLCFPNFIVNTARVHVSDSMRWRLLSKLIQQQCNEVNGVTYIHVLIHCLVNFSTCLYSTGTPEDVNSNIDVQVTSIGALNEYCSRLIPLSTTNQLTHQSSSFTCYIDSVMKSTKLVKRILMSSLSIVNLNNSMAEHTKLLQFNFADDNYKFIVQVGLIKLLTTLIELESKVMPQQNKSTEDLDLKQETGKYIPGYALQDQPLFKHLILHGLRNCTYHWEDLLRKSIGSPRLSGGLWSFVQGVVGVLCDNIVSRSSIEVNLETLTSILHYIILDTDVDSTKSHQPTTESTIYSLLTSWLPQSGSHTNSNGNNNVVGSSNEMSPKHAAKVNLLNEFGHVLNTLGFVWVQESNLKNKVIQLLNPIALTHMDDFVRATADVPTTDHIVDIILHLNVIRLANLTSSTITVISSGKTSKCINMLQLYSQYIGSIGSSLSQDLPMPLLIQLLRECSNLPPEGQNLLLVILNRVMCTFGLPPSITRQEVKELQECTQKLLEFISNNASPVELNKKRNSCANINECLTCLSNNLPGLLDIVWGSEDKDKLLPVLSHVVYLVFPHLKSKTSPTFEPATILFVNLTKFTHLKKAWKKEIFDHLIDPSFFRMSLEDFKNWLIILDNVFSQDKGSFSELIARATVPTSNSLNIFTSKETEYENRAMLLKRLAVVIYSSSNMDEYVKFITSIQERISESLKASATVIPNIQLSVFLLFRVLLVKLSVSHLTSLWPIIIHEISVVLALLEQDLISSMNNIITPDGRMEKPWNSVYSSVFKLLQEASKLPLFRMYSWNFTNNIIPRLKQHNHNDLITAFEKIEEEQSSIEDDFIEV